ncbi:MAG: ABC transporter substrate-binding protein [Desulfarculaceae bacterium]|nr:ABC transporter substrate-binding protein [Desulfarculaceae bacterium]
MRIWFVAALILTLLLAPSVAPAAEPVKIGLILPMTGPAAAYGDMAYKGVQMAQAKRPQVLGRPVKLILVDNRSDKTESSNAANRLIQRDKVALIIGALSSTPTLAAAPVAEDAKVPLVSGWATNPLVTQKKKCVFRTCFVDPFQGSVAARFAFDTLRARRAALLIDISRDYSVGLASAFVKAFKKLGGKVVARTMYSNGDQEFGAQLGMIKKRSADLIYLPGYLPELPLIVRQAREMGLDQPFLGGDAAQAEQVISSGGKALEGFYLTTHFDEQGVSTPAGKEYVAAYRAKHKKAPDALGALGYDVYNVVLDALAKAGSTDAAKVTAALEATKGFPGVCGVMDLVEHNAVKPAVILTIDKGKFKYVTTVKP